MNDLTIKRLAGVVIVALVLWGALAGAGHLREDRATRFSLPHLDSAAIDTIVIGRRSDTTTLVRTGHAWTENGHPADSAHVRDMLVGLVDSTAWGELVAQSSASYARLGVDADSGRRVRVVSRGKLLLDITSGKRTTDWSGLYLRRAGDSAVYALHSGALGEALTRSSDDWRDKRIARVNPDSVASAVVERGARTVALRRDAGKWLAGDAPADSSAVARTLELYRSLDAAGFATDAQTDSLRTARQIARVRLKSKSGSSLLDITFDSTASGGWARTGSGGPVFKIDSYQLAQLAPADSAFRVKKPSRK